MLIFIDEKCCCSARVFSHITPPQINLYQKLHTSTNGRCWRYLYIHIYIKYRYTYPIIHNYFLYVSMVSLYTYYTYIHTYLYIYQCCLWLICISLFSLSIFFFFSLSLCISFATKPPTVSLSPHSLLLVHQQKNKTKTFYKKKHIYILNPVPCCHRVWCVRKRIRYIIPDVWSTTTITTAIVSLNYTCPRIYLLRTHLLSSRRMLLFPSVLHGWTIPLATSSTAVF